MMVDARAQIERLDPLPLIQRIPDRTRPLALDLLGQRKLEGAWFKFWLWCIQFGFLHNELQLILPVVFVFL